MNERKNIQTIFENLKSDAKIIDITDFLKVRKNIASDLLAIAAQIDDCSDLINYEPRDIVKQLETLSLLISTSSNKEDFDDAFYILNDLYKQLIKK